MHRRSAIAYLTVVALSCVALVGCARGASVYAGRVVDDVEEVQAPTLSVPAANLDAGFASAPSAAGGTGTTVAGRSVTSTIAAITGVGAVARVVRVAVRTGDTVTAGQELAEFETGALDAGVAVARAAQVTARSQVPVIDAALDTARSAGAELTTTRASVESAISKLAATRVQLADKLATLKALLAALQRAGASAPGRPPGGVPTSTVPPGGVPSSTPSPRRPPGGVPSPARLRVAVGQLEGAIARIDAGLSTARAGLTRLASAKGTLADARLQLRDLRELVSLSADASAIGVRVAEYQRGLATVRAPVSGVVVSVAREGDVLAPGAPVAVIRRTGNERVTTWVAPAELIGVHLGDVARVRSDWASGSRTGRVSVIGPRADYPPTSYPTKDVHLTRAVPVEIVMDDVGGAFALPPGAPVEVEFSAEWIQRTK